MRENVVDCEVFFVAMWARRGKQVIGFDEIRVRDACVAYS